MAKRTKQILGKSVQHNLTLMVSLCSNDHFSNYAVGFSYKGCAEMCDSIGKYTCIALATLEASDHNVGFRRSWPLMLGGKNLKQKQDEPRVQQWKIRWVGIEWKMSSLGPWPVFISTDLPPP